jgi:hypothetical protein
LVERLGSTNPWVKRTFPMRVSHTYPPCHPTYRMPCPAANRCLMCCEQLFTKAGAIPPSFFNACKRWKKELKTIFTRCSAHLVAKQDAKEAERARLASMSDKDRSREVFEKNKSDMLNRLARLGVEASDTDIYDDTSKTPEEYAKDVHKEQTEDDIRAYEMFERFKRHTRGLHSCDILLGRSRVSMSFAGADIVELVPAPDSIAEVKDAMEEREKQYFKDRELDLSGWSLTSEDMII